MTIRNSSFEIRNCIAEQALVAANRELIVWFEKKIKNTLARVWGEEALTDSPLCYQNS